LVRLGKTFDLTVPVIKQLLLRLTELKSLGSVSRSLRGLAAKIGEAFEGCLFKGTHELVILIE
jgi:hypothetical protein